MDLKDLELVCDSDFILEEYTINKSCKQKIEENETYKRKLRQCNMLAELLKLSIWIDRGTSGVHIVNSRYFSRDQIRQLRIKLESHDYTVYQNLDGSAFTVSLVPT